MNASRFQQPDWERRYVENDLPWDRGEPCAQFGAWLEAGQLADGPVLVPGCGLGHEVVQLCRQGFDVTAIDLAATAISRLGEALEREQLAPRATLIQGDFLEFTAKGCFATVYEQTSLCAVSPDRWTEYAERLAACLRPDGVLLALFMQTGRDGGPPWHCDLLAMQRLFRPPTWSWRELGNPADHPNGLRELPAVLVRGHS